MRRMGPGLLVTAAFIGPGTIVTASQSGASFGMALLWAVAFSALATAVLQEMAARVGLVTRRSLGEAIRESLTSPLARWFSVCLVAVAITFGNAAYETGNLLGASLGLEILTGLSPRLWAVTIATCALALIMTGAYRAIQRVLVVLVVFMSCLFFVTAILARPSLSAFIGGFVPTIPEGGLVTVIALIGTTVVPYNLFLHASTAREKWTDTPLARALPESRWDTIFSVALGGLVTAAIVVMAAPLTGFGNLELRMLALQLEPVLGSWSTTLFGLGLFAAGLTSAITAPLGAAYAACGVLGFPPELRSKPFRAISAFVVVTGCALVFIGGSPTEMIVLAQASNALLLPLIALFLLFVVNDSSLMGSSRNSFLSNLLGAGVVLVVSGLGIYKLLSIFGIV